MSRKQVSPGSTRRFAGAGLVLVTTAAAVAASELNALLTVQGLNNGDRFGEAVAVVGDVNGDGFPDLAAGSANGEYALVVSGADGSTIHTLRSNGGAPGDLFGSSVAGLGDVNFDGVPDIAVGAPQFKAGLGSVDVFSGQDGSTITVLYGDAGTDNFGSSVAGLGDVDGDGVADLVVGARKAYDPNTGNTPGMAKVVLGNNWSTWYALYGDQSGDDFGASVANAGDVDGDGVDDFAVGAEYGTDGTNNPGYVRVFAGSHGGQIQTIYGTAHDDRFGGSLASAGDVDFDGVPELLVGAPNGADGSGNATGYASVVSIPNASAVYSVYGVVKSERFGHAIAGGKDLDADGTPDFVVGVPLTNDENGNMTGAVRSFSGIDGSELDTVFATSPDVGFGWSVALVDDITSDGKPDIFAGVPGDDALGNDNGAAVVMGGVQPKPPTGAVLVDGGTEATATPAVTLDLAWVAGDADVVEMRIRNEGGEWGEWIEVAPIVEWTLPAVDGTQSVEVQVRDAAGLESESVFDEIVLDTTKPTGTIDVVSDVAWVRSTAATLAFTYSDGTGTGVTRMRVRNGDGGEWSEWQDAATTMEWTLTDGAGIKEVQAEFEDAVGNVSDAASAQTAIDPDGPTGAIAISGGAVVTSSRTVSLSLTAADGAGSGVSDMRLRAAGGAWTAWSRYVPTTNWDLDAANGTPEVEAQFRDVAGNESEVFSDGIVFDDSRPVIDSVAVHTPALFYGSDSEVAFDLVTHDGSGGSGVSAARTSWDGGATWTAWTLLPAEGPYVPARPALSGAAAVRVAVRDLAFNESVASAPLSLYFLDATPPDAGSGAKIKGGISAADDLDVYGVDLVVGDSLSAILKAKTGVKKQPFALSVDLVGPDGQTVVTGRYPGSARAAGIKGFVAPATGRYLLVVRRADGAGAPSGTYAISLGVKAAKANSAGKGTDAASFSFDAASGASFSATLSGAGIDAGSVSIEGPDGTVAATVKVKGSKVTVAPVALTSGTGTYTVRYTAAGPVAFSWKTALPKGVKLSE